MEGKTARAGVCLVRHGQTEWNVQRRMLGQGDPPLNPRGRAEARELAEALSGARFVAILSSDLQRAAETAGILGAALGLEVTLSAEWREQHRGAWTGLTRAEVRQRWPDEFARYRSEDPDSRPSGGESRRELDDRIRAARAHLDVEYAGQQILVVTHRGVIRVLAPGLKPGHASLTRLG